MPPKKLKKAQKGKNPETWLEEGIASERPATTGSSRPSTAASASEINPARHTVAYRIDIHRIPPRGSSLHATTSAPTTPSHSSITLHSFNSEIDFTKLPPKLRQSASAKFSLCQELESEVKGLKKKPSAGNSADQGHVRVYEKELELLEAQHEFLNLQVYIAEQEAERSGKPLSNDPTYLDTTYMRDLVSRTILSTKCFLKDEATIPSKKAEEIKADMDRLGLAYALLVAEQFRQYDKIPDWLRRQDDAQANFKRQIIAAYPELERTSYGTKQYWCPVAKRWNPLEEMRAAHLVPHHFGYAQVGCLFGEPNKGYDHVWNVRNGLHLDRAVEEVYDKGQIIIVPYDDSNDGQRWRLKVVDEFLLTNPMRGPWRDLHNKELDFREATARPGRRYLYAHYITTLLRMYRMKKPGWQIMVEERKQKKVWASPGKWYQESTLKHLARYVADEADAPGLFSESLSASAPVVPQNVGESMSMAIAHEDEERIAKAMRNLHQPLWSEDE